MNRTEFVGKSSPAVFILAQNSSIALLKSVSDFSTIAADYSRGFVA